jgi:hypothetical protein
LAKLLAGYHPDVQGAAIANMVLVWLERYRPEGRDRLLTDYPYDMGDEDPVGTIRNIPRLKNAERERILGGNAARLLKIRARTRR